MIDKKIGKQIKLLRIMRDMTQRQISERSGISQRVISAVEDGKSLTIDNLDAIARAFGLELWQIIKSAEELTIEDEEGAA